MRPFHAGHALGGVDDVPQNEVNRNAVAIRVVDRHRGVLHSDRPVGEHRQRFALYLRVAVRHAHGGLLVATSDELRTLVPAIIDDRFVNSAETRSRIGANVLESERLDYIHHEVRSGSIRGQDLSVRRHAGFGFRRHGWRNGPQQLSFLLRGNRSWGRGQSCRTRRCTFQEIPAVDC